MPRIKAKNELSLSIDGMQVQVKVPSRRNFELNRALANPERFREFASDPRRFVAQYDLQIDRDISDQLVQRLKGIDSLGMLKDVLGPDVVGATLWAVAAGVYSVASSKVAVAF